MELIAGQVGLDSVTTGDVMSPEFITAEENGGLEGILTVNDLVELLADELALLAKRAGRGQELEEEKRE